MLSGCFHCQHGVAVGQPHWQGSVLRPRPRLVSPHQRALCPHTGDKILKGCSEDGDSHAQLSPSHNPALLSLLQLAAPTRMEQGRGGSRRHLLDPQLLA